MKKRNPKSRYDLKIGRSDRVLEVGGGHNPHRRSDVVVDKYVDSNYHRKSDIRVLPRQEFLAADGADLPFADKSFDYVICNQVLEHVEDPVAFLAEQSRVASRGYIETPSLIGEYLFPKKAHKWLILEMDGILVLMEKDKFWFDTKMDFGFLFLTWLQKNSLAYKLLSLTRPDVHTVRYEWENEIEVLVNPEDEKYRKYFSEYWDQDMVSVFFPERAKLSELASVAGSLLKIIASQALKPFLGKA